jgi:hypothetical protein
MLTLEEIRQSKINPLAVREAYSQAEKRLAYASDTKKALEQKSFTLLNAYITVSAALFGAAGFLLRDSPLTGIPLPFILSGTLTSVGAMVLVWALLDQPFGAQGSDPNMWLNKGTIDGDDNAAYVMLAYVVYYHQDRIDLSVASIESMARKMRIAVLSGVAAPLVFAAVALLQAAL